MNKTQLTAIDALGQTELHDAIQRNNMPKFNYAVRQFDVNAQDNYGNTPIFLAVQEPENGLVMMDLLVKNKADINHKNKIQQTALHWAVVEKNKEMIEYLIHNGADIFQKDVMRRSVLHFALQSEVDESLQEYLLDQFVGKLNEAIDSIEHEHYRSLLTTYFGMLQKSYKNHPEKFATLATELATVVRDVPELLHDKKNVEAKNLVHEFYEHSSKVLTDKKVLRVLGIIAISLLALASGAAVGLAAGSTLLAGATALDALVGVSVAGFTATQTLVGASAATLFAGTALGISKHAMFANDDKAADIKDNAIMASA
jgi:hypothetical protein